MKPEELKQLKQDDEIFIRARYKYIDSDGDVRFYLSVTSVFGGMAKGEGHTLPENVILPSEFQPSPKQDPCRLFKKGDKVRVVERHGRKFWEDEPETIYTVVADEYLHDDQSVLHRGCVGLNDGKPETRSSWNVPFFHVELVTPVEELEPYFLFEDTYSWQVKRENKLCCRYGKSTHPHAKEAAEDECARLNAEHRKEQA